VKAGRPLSLLAAAALLVALSACTLSPWSESETKNALPTESRLPPLTSRDHQRILESFGGEYEAPAPLEKLAVETLERLAAASDKPSQRYRLTVLNSANVNAFALPSGHLYITRGMLALINDTAEFAAVLGHEMAHVSADHAAMREDQVKTDEIVAEFRSRVLKDKAGAEQRIASGKLSLAGFSRAQEVEADVIGVKTLAKAGFDSYAASRFLKDLERFTKGTSPSSGQPDFAATHPSTPERVQQALIAARQFTGPDSGERNREKYLKGIDGLAYGEDARRGLIRNRQYIHARLGFSILVPEGFTLDNSAQAVTGIGPNDTALRLDAAKVPASQSLADYLSSGWIEGLIPGTIEPTTINGFQVASAIARSGDWNFRITVIRFGAEVYRVIFGAKTLTPDIDAAFRASMESFRRLTPAETRDLKQPRIKIVKVGFGDSSVALGGRMGRSDDGVALFRLLNGLETGEDLPFGSYAKITDE
jgi:predicted Zn-dependent protease